jgi:glyoxylate/hydroxypyruvate reductase
MSQWLQALQLREPGLKIEIWPDIGELAAVKFVLVWKHSPGVLRFFPNLKCISSLGAGVDGLLEDRDLPPGVPLVRIFDTELKQSMAEYVCLGALNHFRRFDQYRQQQACGDWQALPLKHISEMRAGILGLGELGSCVAEKLSVLGFQVHGWSRTARPEGQMRTYHGADGLKVFLAVTDILVCLLPLTPATRNILDIKLFRQLPAGAYIINVARGEHLVEADLLAEIESGHIAGALLDVFREEPLASDHPFRRQPQIMVTPHISAITNPDSAVPQLLENYHRALAGQPLLHQIDPRRGY